MKETVGGFTEFVKRDLDDADKVTTRGAHVMVDVHCPRTHVAPIFAIRRARYLVKVYTYISCIPGRETMWEYIRSRENSLRNPAHDRNRPTSRAKGCP